MQPTFRRCGLALTAALVCSAAHAAGWNNGLGAGQTTPYPPYGAGPQFNAFTAPGMAPGGVGGALGFNAPGLPGSGNSNSWATPPTRVPAPGMTPMPGASTYDPAMSNFVPPSNAASTCDSGCGNGFGVQPNFGGNYGGPLVGSGAPMPSPIGAPPIMTGTEYGNSNGPANYDAGPASYDAGLFAGAGGWNGNPYLAAMQAPWQAAACGPVVPRPRRCGPRWFGGVYGLYMNRDDNNQIHFLTDPAVSGSTYLCSPDADMEWSGGYELRLGRTFHNGCCGMEVVYWELFPSAQDAAVSQLDVPGATLYGTMDYRDVYLDFGFGPDTIANQFTDSGALYGALLQRDWGFRNLEVNLLSRPIYAGGGFRCGGGRRCAGYGGAGYYGPAVGGGGGICGGGICGGGICGDGATCGMGQFPGAASAGCCGPCANGCPPRLHIGWSAGVRYFRFDESLRLTYDNFDAVYDGTNPDTEFDHFTRVENDLVGAQLGLNLDYYLSRCIHLELGSKMGLYGNHVDHVQRIYNGYGDAYVFPGASAEYVNVRESDVDVAFLGELRAGLAYRVGCHWRLAAGYRAISASGLALTTNQLPFGRAFNNLASVGRIDRNGDLILHGAYAGVEFAW